MDYSTLTHFEQAKFATPTAAANPPSWRELRRHPTLYRLLAGTVWRTYQRENSGDAELERAWRTDKARGHDPRLALDLREIPSPWQRNGLKCPPFTKDLPERLRLTSDLRIFAGAQAWAEAKHWHTRTHHAVAVLPPGDSPAI